MLAVLLGWFPERKFVFSGDGGYATHDLAQFAKRHHPQLTLVSRFYANANLYAALSQQTGKKNDRPRKKGHKLPTPEEVVKQSGKRRKLTVAWYGGGQRKVEVITGTGHWYQAGAGLVEIRWVFVHDLTATHRDDYFFTTDISLSPKAIIEIYTGRWSIETMFQEMRAYLGQETTPAEHAPLCFAPRRCCSVCTGWSCCFTYRCRLGGRRSKGSIGPANLQ